MLKKLVAALLTIGIGTLALADTQGPMSGAAAEGERTTETLKQLERDWADAERAGDSDKIAQIVADDWTGINNEGSKLTKEQLIARIKSGKVKTECVELGPMEVKVLGDVAVVQGSDVEKGTTNGNYTSGELVWMDVFTKRNGKWVAVRSQSTWAATSSRARWPI
jgi:ketosteroid isomerase-like protein